MNDDRVTARMLWDFYVIALTMPFRRGAKLDGYPWGVWAVLWLVPLVVIVSFVLVIASAFL